jgi:hypothetical protein
MPGTLLTLGILTLGTNLMVPTGFRKRLGSITCLRTGMTHFGLTTLGGHRIGLGMTLRPPSVTRPLQLAR